MVIIIFLCSENKDRDGDDLTSNHIVNIKGYATSRENYSVTFI